MAIRKSNIPELAAFLEQACELQADPILNNKDIVKALLTQITALRTSGLSLEQISSLLKKRDVSISDSTLKSYLQQANREKTRKPKPKKQSKPEVHLDVLI